MRVGVVRYWAGRPAAEHEVIARLKTSAEARGHTIIDLNPDGSMLTVPGVVPQNLDFVLNLHFSSPKCRDLPHVGVLWNPIEFYHLFGYKAHFANQLSFDYLATCGSRSVERAVAPLRPELLTAGLPILNHTVPADYLEPVRMTDRRLFYIGINWERTQTTNGRHSTLLGLLDDAAVSKIYGPREIDGVAPWAGYRTYQCDVPFDGRSVIETIAASGAALIVSSAAHYHDGVMSCRPFEAAAAGVPLISERHPFMLEHFGDAALFFDESAPVEEQAEEIVEIIRGLNRDPEGAIEVALRAQEIVRQHFNLDDQFDRLCSWVAARETERQLSTSGAVATAVVVPVQGLRQTEEWALRNVDALSRFAEVVLAPPSDGADWEVVAELIGPKTRLAAQTRADATWSARASKAVEHISGPVCFLTGVEELYGSYPDNVAECTRAATVLPAVTMPAPSDCDANTRLPRLLCSSASDWWELPIAALITTAERLAETRRLLGPGLHLGVIAETAIELDAENPRFVPCFSVDAEQAAVWVVGPVVGDERHRDAQIARMLPTRASEPLPKSLLRSDTNAVTPMTTLPPQSFWAGSRPRKWIVTALAYPKPDHYETRRGRLARTIRRSLTDTDGGA